MQELIIFQTENSIQIEVNFDGDTVWLTEKQLSELFQRDRTVINRHINNIFKENELDEKVVCAYFAHTTQHGALKGKSQTIETRFYNLDVIISVGYRVKSKQGTQFRQWATQRLKEHLIQGYTINQKRLDELQQTVQLIQQSIDSETNLTEAKGLLEIITQYTQSFILLWTSTMC